MRTAVCNEMFGAIPFAEQCALTARHGFQGIELAPYTLAEDPMQIRPARAREIRRIIEEAGLACAGLHWLLRMPAGLHLTTPDSPRARDPASYRELAAALAPAVDEHRGCAEALDCARAAAGEDGLVAVAGSLYLVGEARRLLGGG